MSPSQDALFFLKDFFSNLASFVNPYLPVDPAAEGELRLMMVFLFFDAYFITCLSYLMLRTFAKDINIPISN